MGTGFSKKKKQAKKLQEQFAKMQEDLKKAEHEGSAGNGLVKMVLNGEGQLKKIKINPECVDPEDVEGLEDLIKAAYEDASSKIQDQEMPGMPGGMPGGMPNIPGMPDLSGFGF